VATQAATARLALDASGFDKQANASFREFSKQLTSVKDATDVAMRGAEALQKVFVKSIGGTIAIGAASALGDAMRDVGNRIGEAGNVASQAIAGLSGVAGSMEEAATRAATLASSADSARKSLEEMRNANPIQQGIFKLFGGDRVLQDLEESLRGLSGQELLSGMREGNRGTRRMLEAGPTAAPALQQQMAEEKQRRDLRSSAAFRGADAATQEKIMAEFEKKLSLDRAMKQQAQDAKDAENLQKTKEALQKKLADYQQEFSETMLTRDLADARKAREGERDSAELLAKAQADLAKLTQERAQEISSGSPNRGLRSLRAGAATEILDRASTLGGPLASSVERERRRQDADRKRQDRLALDRAVMAGTSEFTAEGGRRTMASRRNEFIAQQARTEAGGGKTLTDVYKALQDALNRLTDAPVIRV